MSQSNILFIVWDACRLDAARQHAPTLDSLAEENLWFENAITPGSYSLPAHASFMTGKYPHEHGLYSRTQSFASMPLLDALDNTGYATYGVSANGFASAMYGFDEGFDAFYNTQGQTVYPEGLDVHGHVRRHRSADTEEFSPGDLSIWRLLSNTLRHEHPLKSLANVAAAGLSEIVREYSLLQSVPHSRFSQYHEFNYAPRKNTQCIESILEREAGTTQPFFLFANYMDAHHPYAPPTRYQREFCDRRFTHRELTDLAERTHPWSYMERVRNGQRLPEQVLESIRGLYAGEVRTADDHLDRLLDALEQYGHRENTLLVITADHGENLGETDQLGETRMGHECSASDNLLRVPLLIAHPALRSRRVEDYVSTKDLYELFTGGIPRLLETEGQEVDPLLPKDEVVASQVPPPANDALRERYPALTDVLERYISVAYADGWKLVITSRGTRQAWRNGEKREIGDVPNHLVQFCRCNLDSLMANGGDRSQLTEAEKKHLEALGYL